MARVEVHNDQVHMVVSLEEMGEYDPKLSKPAGVEARLRLGDRLVPEVTRLRHARIAIPIRMKLRGGRTWIEDTEILHGRRAAKVRLDAIKRLKAAHDVLEPAHPALSPQRSRVRLARPPVSDSAVLEWAFLAPDIQSDIAFGRLDLAALEQLKNLAKVPLSWAVQRRLLEQS